MAPRTNERGGVQCPWSTVGATSSPCSAARQCGRSRAQQAAMPVIGFLSSRHDACGHPGWCVACRHLWCGVAGIAFGGRYGAGRNMAEEIVCPPRLSLDQTLWVDSKRGGQITGGENPKWSIPDCCRPLPTPASTKPRQRPCPWLMRAIWAKAALRQNH